MCQFEVCYRIYYSEKPCAENSYYVRLYAFWLFSFFSCLCSFVEVALWISTICIMVMDGCIYQLLVASSPAMPIKDCFFFSDADQGWLKHLKQPRSSLFHIWIFLFSFIDKISLFLLSRFKKKEITTWIGFL